MFRPCFPIAFHIFSCSLDDEENVVDEGAEDFKPSEPQSKAEARGAYLLIYINLLVIFTSFGSPKNTVRMNLFLLFFYRNEIVVLLKK